MDSQAVSGSGAFRIVCLCGSAGALLAYVEILKSLPAHTGMAFVIASHREQDHAGLFAQLLSAATAMPVVEVRDRMRISPDCVFLMPAGREMRLVGDRFEINDTPRRRGWPRSISIFLASLAEDAGARAIAVILSGHDGDGSSAMAAIKASGGLTFAQSDAKHSDMPRAAFETGHVDFILPPAGIAERLMALAA